MNASKQQKVQVKLVKSEMEEAASKKAVDESLDSQIPG